MLATDDKNTPIYLHCVVSARISDEIKIDFQTKKKFYELTPKDVERDVESEPHYSNDLIKQMYDDQKKRFYKQNTVNSTTKIETDITTIRKSSSIVNEKKLNESNEDDEDDDVDDYYDDEEDPQHRVIRQKRETRDSFTYEWLKNDNSILSFAYSMKNQPITKKGYTLYPNGTLKFIPSSVMAGIYRCKAKYTFLDPSNKNNGRVSSRNFKIGPILSLATVVEALGK